MKKYGDIINGFGYSGCVKSIDVDESGVSFAVVQNHIGASQARVYLVPPVWEENKLPIVGDNLVLGGLVSDENNKDTNNKKYDVAGKAIFPAVSSIGRIIKITSWKEDHPFAIVAVLKCCKCGSGKCCNCGNVKLSLSPDVWFEPRFPEVGDNVVVCGIIYLCGEYFARGGLFWRIG